MMIVRIMVQIKYFVVIMVRAACLSGTFCTRQLSRGLGAQFVMILGFTFPFYVMFNESDRLRVNVDKRAYDNIMMSAISTYNMVSAILESKQRVQLWLTVLASGRAGRFQHGRILPPRARDMDVGVVLHSHGNAEYCKPCCTALLLLLPTTSDMCSACRCC